MRLIDANALEKAIGDLYGLPFEEMVEDFTWLKAIGNAPTVCGNNPKWCESCVSKGKCASTRPQDCSEITNEDIQNAIKQGYNDGFEMAKAKFERPKGKCKDCEYLQFTERFIEVIVEVMNKYNITSVEELEQRARGGAE